MLLEAIRLVARKKAWWKLLLLLCGDGGLAGKYNRGIVVVQGSGHKWGDAAG